METKQKFTERLKQNLLKKMQQLEDLQLQTALGKMEAKTEFEKQKSEFKKFVNKTTANKNNIKTAVNEFLQKLNKTKKSETQSLKKEKENITKVFQNL